MSKEDKMSKAQILLGTTVAIMAVGVFSFEFFKLHNDHDHDTHTSNELDSHSDKHDVHDDHDDHNEHTATYGPLIEPLTIPTNIDIDLAKIGWHLFKDPNLSSNKHVSCESCHNLSTNGADLLPQSVGVNGVGTRNSPTVFNSSLNYRQFWDGRVDSLAAQLDGPIHNPQEMDTSWSNIVEYVSSSTLYIDIFSDSKIPINQKTITSALVEFQNGLITPNARFDQFLNGDETALNAQEKDGWQLFNDKGCISCHRGNNIGGGMLVKFGVFGNSTTGEERLIDTGRFLATNQQEDMFIFRVASLRNAADTAPYFHDGQTNTLEEAIEIMGKSQLGVTLNPNEVADLAAFIKTLSGEKPKMLERFTNEAR